MASCPHSTATAFNDVTELDALGPAVDVDEARSWLELYFAETNPRGDLEQRWRAITADLARSGTYVHTFGELEWGARVAWRQSVRCIGRARWQSLVVRDARTAATIDEIAAELTKHLQFATNAGRIRSTITVFRQDGAAGPRVRVANEQLIRYAGYADNEGRTLGDPRYVDFTALLASCGWQPPSPPSAFDVLPWLIETEHERPRVVPVPDATVLEVPVTHPDLPWFSELCLRWHAVPVISNMRLRIGGINYSCAPFNGFYLVDEIATRNFGDVDRYDQLPEIATRMGLDTTSSANFWQLRAAVELNTAVLHSFRAAGVRIEEPVAESALFSEFAKREEAAGRRVYGDWSWINGHIGSTFGRSWHRYYDTDEPNPNFWLDPGARELSFGHPRSGPLTLY
ncbi:MAG: nitric oxide synthase oxygenase [Actinomycetota bacterium]|nr:nitric oxide synthase oxygenase [Actinomycetota bacterium]